MTAGIIYSWSQSHYLLLVRGYSTLWALKYTIVHTPFTSWGYCVNQKELCMWCFCTAVYQKHANVNVYFLCTWVTFKWCREAHKNKIMKMRMTGAGVGAGKVEWGRRQSAALGFMPLCGGRSIAAFFCPQSLGFVLLFLPYYSGRANVVPDFSEPRMVTSCSPETEQGDLNRKSTEGFWENVPWSVDGIPGKDRHRHPWNFFFSGFHFDTDLKMQPTNSERGTGNSLTIVREP